MKKLFLTLLLITVFFSSQTWGTVLHVTIEDRYEGLVLRNDGLYYKEFTDIPFTGKISGWKGTVEKSIFKEYLRVNGKFKNGLKEGVHETYYDNGQLRWKENYKDGLKEGQLKFYNEDGSLYRTETYKNGVLVSE